MSPGPSPSNRIQERLARFHQVPQDRYSSQQYGQCQQSGTFATVRQPEELLVCEHMKTWYLLALVDLYAPLLWP